MKRKVFKILYIGLIIFISLFILLKVSIYFAFKDINESHVEGNIPNVEVFDTYLYRDISKYFEEKGFSNFQIKYEFLRDKPTQSGLAYPKYYLWVFIYSVDNTLIDQGALRLAAIDKQYFQVTDFISIDEIKNDQSILDPIFPVDIIKKIEDYLKPYLK